MVCRGGIYPSRGGLRRRKVRRDEGIPPYGRPGGRGRTGWPQHFPWFVGEGHGPPAGPCGSAGSLGTMQASSPTLVCGIAGFVVSRLVAAFCLPCQREVARPKAVTEGLSYGQMPFQRSGVTEKFFCLELRLPGTSASFYAIPRSPLSPPLTRGPNQPANVPAAAGSGGMRASRPTFARVVEAAPVGRAFAMVRRGGPNHPANVPAPPTPIFAAACGRRSTLSKL